MTSLQRLSAALAALCLVVPAWAQKPAPAKAKAAATQAAPATPRLRAPGHVLETIRKRGGRRTDPWGRPLSEPEAPNR